MVVRNAEAEGFIYGKKDEMKEMAFAVHVHMLAINGAAQHFGSPRRCQFNPFLQIVSA